MKCFRDINLRSNCYWGIRQGFSKEGIKRRMDTATTWRSWKKNWSCCSQSGCSNWQQLCKDFKNSREILNKIPKQRKFLCIKEGQPVWVPHKGLLRVFSLWPSLLQPRLLSSNLPPMKGQGTLGWIDNVSRNNRSLAWSLKTNTQKLVPKFDM